MFDLPNDDAGTTQSTRPLPLTEPSQTVEPLLEHMDPKIQTPDINPDTIINLLEVAQKYQVPTITIWFENEVKHMRGIVYMEAPSEGPNGATMTSFLRSHPIIVLHCAVQFQLPALGRLALKEFSRCDMSLLDSTNTDLSLSAYLYGMGLRQARTEVFRKFLTVLSKAKDKQLRSYTDTRGRLITEYAADGRNACITCAAERAAWVLKIEYAIARKPLWDVFIEAYESANIYCQKCSGTSWANHYREGLAGWKLKVDETECQLPEWPFK